MKRTNRRRYAAILTVSCALLAAFAGTAQAGPGNGVCEHGEMCLFDHANYGGSVLFDRPEAQIVQWGGLPLAGWAVNRASSFANRTGRFFRIYAYEKPWDTYAARPWQWSPAFYLPGWNDIADGVAP